jgi:hypothetical protein
MPSQSETIRPLIVGRGNWQFLGHPGAAPGRMRMSSVVRSAHRHHLVVKDHLEDVLRTLADAEQRHLTLGDAIGRPAPSSRHSSVPVLSRRLRHLPNSGDYGSCDSMSPVKCE